MAVSEGDLRSALERRFKGDRSGACIAAAVIENGTSAKVYYCADPKSSRSIDDRTAFEIGSVTKTMVAMLVAELLGEDETTITLDDPLAKILPSGTVVPSFNGSSISIRHLLENTSGLPSFPWRITDFGNPYARLTEADLLDALTKTQLSRAPGSRREYSNFAFMVLSYALAKFSGKDFETLLRERLLLPLDMNDTFIVGCPSTVRLAQGHFSNGKPTGPWDVQSELAGAGGVRATLPDMVGYLEGQLGMRNTSITPILVRTHEQIGEAAGMAWEILYTEDGRRIVMHPGGTGGFSTFFAFDRVTRSGVVLLSDTALTEVGGLRRVGMHLLDPSLPIGTPRTTSTANVELIDALVGRYHLASGLGMELRRKSNRLTIQADDQPEFEMEYDSAGEFYALEFDAILQPRRRIDGTYTFTWYQLGGIHQAERNGTHPPAAPTPLNEAQLKEYEGNYILSKTLALRVLVSASKVVIRATGQAPQEAAFFDKDVFVTEPFGAEIVFQRNDEGRITGLAIHQRGQILRGERH